MSDNESISELENITELSEKILEEERRKLKKSNFKYNDLLEYAAQVSTARIFQDWFINEVSAKKTNSAINMINNSSFPQQGKEKITEEMFGQY